MNLDKNIEINLNFYKEVYGECNEGMIKDIE